jgi:hypothetical protein
MTEDSFQPDPIDHTVLPLTLVTSNSTPIGRSRLKVFINTYRRIEHIELTQDKNDTNLNDMFGFTTNNPDFSEE